MERKTIEQIFQLKLKEQLIGTGASSIVYEIDDDSLPERQVLKVMDICEMAEKLCDKAGISSPTEDVLAKVKEKQLELYEKELLHNEQLLYTKNPYFVRILEPYEYGAAQDKICLRAMRMPYYQTLEEFLKEGGFSENQILRLGLNIAEALKVMHLEDVNAYYQSKDMALGSMCHMDIKPENIFCKKQDDRYTFMLGDFGISCLKGEEQIIGRTIGYSAPEVYDRVQEPSESSDMFSLGCVFYYCLCGAEEAESKVLAFWETRCNGEAGIRPAHCSKEFWTIICRATNKEPQERYQTAEELWEALFELALHRKEVTPQERTILKTAEAAGLMAGLLFGGFKAIQKISAASQKKRSMQDGTLDLSKLGARYEGGLKNDEPCGKGVFYYTYGEETRSIEGTWKWVRKAKIKYKGGKVTYTGMLCDGVISGLGEIHFPKVGKYLGITRMEEFQYGTMNWESGEAYFGTWAWKDGQMCQHGQGNYMEADGSVRRGRWEYGILTEPETE